MERRGPDHRDLGFNPDSPVKLPLAPILSTPPDRRGPTRRGTSIFSPTQTLDHNNRNHLAPPQSSLRPPPVLKDPSPDPDPSTPTPDGPSNSRIPLSLSPSPSPRQQVQPPEAPSNGGGGVRYRECLKNHAASMGGRVVDGCGEFMPSGEDGTVEALRCAACDCHRNFHRKEADCEAPQPQPSSFRIHRSNRSQTAAPLAAAPAHHRPHGFAAAAPAMVSFGSGAPNESSSEDLAMLRSGGGGHAGAQPPYSGSKKRFRTKFSQEQKDRMQEVAERLGWRIQKQDEEKVQQLCAETGVKRQVFKVWMHNNKQAMKKRQT